MIECEDVLSGSILTLKVAKVTGALSLEVAALIRLQGVEGVPKLERHGELLGCEALLCWGVGKSIWKVLEEQQALQPEKILKGFDDAALESMAHQLVATLSAVHGRGVVHRDISPENIVFMGTRWYLIDFGSAGPPGETTATVPVTERFLSDRALFDHDVVLCEDDDFDALVHVLSFLADVLDSSLVGALKRKEIPAVRAMVAGARTLAKDKKRQ